MDLIEAPGTNAPEYTVSEIAGAVKRLVEGEFGRVRVRGELGRVSRPASGHVYLDLKDDRAVLTGCIWKATVRGLAVQPEEGMEVVATGRLTTFPSASKYQIIIESLEPAGVGALMAMLERRKAALAAEGLFDAGRKRPLPFLPEVIGVVTSPSGAVIRDILHRLAERFPRRVLIWPVTVQGATCAAEVAAAIRGFNALAPDGPVPRPDVLIVARGGGSLEDLWGFNEEVVVRAAAESAIPLISAIGHETDTTLIDLAADRRAPTPTAAAEMAVPVRLDLMAQVAKLEERRARCMARGMAQRGQRLRDLARGLPRPEALVREREQALDMCAARLPQALRGLVREKRMALVAGPAGRFGRDSLRAGLDRRRNRVEAAAAALRPGALRLRLAGLADRLESRAGRLGRIGARLTAEPAGRLAALGRTLATLDYKAVLARGFAIVREEEARAVLTRAEAVAPGTRLEIEFADGCRRAVAGGGRTRARRSGRAPEQRRLL
jgi:exodeoxyribonuclease VII large subunit